MNRLRTRCLGLAAAGLLLSPTAVFADDFADVDRLFAAGQFADAAHRADQSLATRPQDARMRFLKGLILSEQGKNTEAIDVFNKLAADHPELPEPQNNLAVLYSKQGQYDQARRALEAAIRTNPSYATAYENLGDVYAKLASQAYSKALQIDGTNNTKVAPKLSMIRGLFSPQATAGRTVASATPAPRPVEPPPPAPAPKPAATDTQGPQAAAIAWASAWSRKDLDGYFAAYTRDFSDGKTRKAWEEEQRARILGKRSISVALTDFDVEVKGDRATVEFHQTYRADALKVASRKRLDMVLVSGHWLIQKESSGS